MTDLTDLPRAVTRIPDIYPAPKIYAEDFFYSQVSIYSYQEPMDTEGSVICSLALDDVEFDTGKYGVKVKPEYYFENFDQEVKTFQAPPDPDKPDSPERWHKAFDCTRISLEGAFPKGEKTGDKIFLCYGVMDGFSGEVRMYNIYEYTYSEGPDIEYVYNPAMPGML